MVDESTTSERASELRVGQIAAAFESTPELWTSTSPESLIGNTLSLDDIRALTTVSQLVANIYNSKFDCLLNNTWNSASSSGLIERVNVKYLTNDPATLTSRGMSPAIATQQRGESHPAGYAFFDFEEMPNLYLGEENVFFEEDVRQEISKRRQQSLFFEKAAGYGGSKQRKLKPTVTAPYPSPMGRAGSTITPRSLRRPMRNTLQPEQSGPMSRVQQLAIAAELQIGTGSQITTDWTETSTSSEEIFLDNLAVSRQQLPGLTSAIEIAQAAFDSSDSSQRIAGVFSPSRLESALKVITLDPERRAAGELSLETELVPGYHRLMFDAAEQTWIAVEPEEQTAIYDGFDADTTPAMKGRQVSPLTAQAMQVAAAMTPTSTPAVISEQAGLDSGDLSSLATTTSPIAAPVYSEADSATRLASRIAQFTSRPSFTAAQGLRSTQSETRKNPSLASSATFASLEALVPAAKRRTVTRMEQSRRKNAQWLAGQESWAPHSFTPATTTTNLRGFEHATTTGAELFAARQMLQAGQGLGQLTRASAGATSIAGEVRMETHSWGSSYDDPAVYVTLEPGSLGGFTPHNSRQGRHQAASANRVVSMPLSSLAALQAEQRNVSVFDASRPEAATPLGKPRATFGGLTLRDSDIVAHSAAHALRHTDATFGDGLVSKRPELATTPITLPQRAGVEGQYYYEMSYDIDAVLLDRFVDISAAGGHIEVRGGRIRQARPANAASATPNRPRRERSVADNLSRRSMLPNTANRVGLSADTAMAEGIRPAGRKALVGAKSPIERGYPALSLSGQQNDIAIDALNPAAAAILAGAYDADLNMLPPMVRVTLEKHLQGAAKMTSGGAGTGDLVNRLAHLSDPSDPATRSKMIRELSILGIDTPELLYALDGATSTGEFSRRDASLPSETSESLSQLGKAERVERALASVADDAIGIRGASAAESIVYRHEYFGDFAPAKIHRTSSTELLQHLLSARTQGRTSTLAYGAELGELMTLGPEGIGSKSLAGAVATGKRKTSTGAPSQAARLNRSEGEAKRRLQHLKRQEVALAKRIQDTTATNDSKSSTDASEARTEQFERFADRVAGAVSTSLQTGESVTLDAAQYGWDGDSMTLAATSDHEGITTFSDRVGRSLTPWNSTAASPGSMGSDLRHGQTALQSLGYDSEAHPLIAALREPDSPVESSTAPLGGSRLKDEPSLAQALRQGTDGVRGFSSLANGVIRDALQRIVMQRMPGGSLPGNLELAHSVLDRANGAFAGLDAGILEFLQSTAARSSDLEPRELRPGFDDWPDDSLEVLRQHGWGLNSTNESSSSSGGEQRIRRLERRVDAAQEAYARLADARQHSQAASARSMDSVDWNLVQTGATRSAPESADLGRLGATMVRAQSVPETEMSYVAPAVKMVAQQAQLKPTHEAVKSNQTTAPPAGGTTKKKKAKKPDIDALASIIAKRIRRSMEDRARRFGRG